MSNNTLAGTPDKPLQYTFAAILSFAIIIGILAAIGWTKHGGLEYGELESRCLILSLFVFPCALQLIVLCILRSRTTPALWWFNCGALFLCQFSYCLLWVFYFTSGKTNQWCSYFALGSAFLMLLFVAIMTYAIMGTRDGEHSEKGQSQTKAEDGAQPGEPQMGRRLRLVRHWETFSHNLSAGVGGHPFWAIMFFMALFLGVSYLFGFAFAFHDQALRAATKGGTKGEMPALHMVNLNSVDDVYRLPNTPEQNKGNETNKAGTDQTAQTATSQSDANISSPAGEPEEEFCFYFEEVKANVGQHKDGCPPGSPNPKRIDSHPDIQLFNSCSLNAIADKLKQETDKGRRVKVALLGHTDNEPIKAPAITSVRYLSNYELSESRAHNVQYEVLQKLRAKLASNLDNIKWTVFPAADQALSQINRGTIKEEMFRPDDLKSIGITPTSSDRKGFIEEIHKRLTTEAIDSRLPAQEKRVVIATIEKISESPVVLQPDQFRNLTAGQHEAIDTLKILASAQNEHIAQSQSKGLRLMDYMYFAIYTITTTGYGDIIPTTAYAKFIASVANIFEVIFLVVFFNALLSLKKGSDNDSTFKTNSLGPLHEKEENLDKSGQTQLAIVANDQKTVSKGRVHH